MPSSEPQNPALERDGFELNRGEVIRLADAPRALISDSNFKEPKQIQVLSRHCEPTGRRKAPPRWRAMTAGGVARVPTQ